MYLFIVDELEMTIAFIEAGANLNIKYEVGILTIFPSFFSEYAFAFLKIDNFCEYLFLRYFAIFIRDYLYCGVHALPVTLP